MTVEWQTFSKCLGPRRPWLLRATYAAHARGRLGARGTYAGLRPPLAMATRAPAGVLPRTECRPRCARYYPQARDPVPQWLVRIELWLYAASECRQRSSAAYPAFQASAPADACRHLVVTRAPMRPHYTGNAVREHSTMTRFLAALAAAACAAAVRASGLVDNPIVGDSLTYLDGASWTVSAPALGISIPASVPGDLITDLQNAAVISDPLYELNWLDNGSLWTNNTWTYSVPFTMADALLDSIEAPASTAEALLVFDGIKMGANIFVNGQLMGQAVDQFLRYNYTLGAAHRARWHGLLRRGVGANTLTVVFDPTIYVLGRYMACTGGWDWAPYSSVYAQQPANPGTAQLFSRGIWKSVYLVSVSTAAITHVVPHTYYTGVFPTAPLAPGAFAPFNVTVRTHMWAPAAVAGTLAATEIPPLRGCSINRERVRGLSPCKALNWPLTMACGVPPAVNFRVQIHCR
jgi:hypothetical protein